MRTKMDKWHNRTSQSVSIDLSEPAGPVYAGEPVEAHERFVRIKPGETVEIEAEHRRSVQDVWCGIHKRPVGNEKLPSRAPKSVCSDASHSYAYQAQGGQGLNLTRILDDGAEVPAAPLVVGLAAAAKDEAKSAAYRPTSTDPDVELMNRARERIAKQKEVS